MVACTINDLLLYDGCNRFNTIWLLFDNHKVCNAFTTCCFTRGVILPTRRLTTNCFMNTLC